ncbi:metallophosphoesterase [Ereboglobus luteus]|uniref:Calcineurin-like phosphoesterase domain-containing protein n=1 Tax=Ereboglobus luteus TaxID=1796921 RepID=A0A2U8E0X2_9BACT|nr:metallophosphoesterase [Ereboglobus luteus]AWI08461.1 hypothetical protein CKA38_03630 [Ereboglobus luteus]
MHRRQFIQTIGISGALAVAGKISAQTAPAPGTVTPSAAPDALVKGTPAVFAPTPDSFTVTVPLAADALVWLEYGETEKLGSTAKGDSFGFVQHDDTVVKIKVRNLKPGTRYYWRVVTKPAFPYIGSQKPVLREPVPETRSQIYTTKTLAPNARKTQFSVWNDTHDHNETIRALHTARRADDDFMIWNGDMSNNVNDRALLPGLYVCPQGVDLAEGPPILGTRGNHDVRGLWAGRMSDYVEYPNGNRPFYAFRSGPIAAIALDTGEDKPDNHRSYRGGAAFEPIIREQAAWLEEVIRRPEMRDAPYRVVFCHIPLRWTDESPQDYEGKGFDRYSLRGRLAWQGALVKWGAQIIISGHTHRHALLQPTKEFPYTQITGGGPQPKRATVIRGHADAGKLKVSVIRMHDGVSLNDLEFEPLTKVA